MTLEEYFEVIDTSVKRMVAPIALITSGYILAIYSYEYEKSIELSKAIVTTACVIAGIYVGVMTFNSVRKIQTLCNGSFMSIFPSVIYAFLFLCIYIGAAVLAINKAI